VLPQSIGGTSELQVPDCLPLVGIVVFIAPEAFR
jgi:hypothetical protein